jgi:hypothetical protein
MEEYAFRCSLRVSDIYWLFGNTDVDMNDMSSRSLVHRKSVIYSSLSSRRPAYFKFEVDEHCKRVNRSYKFDTLHPDLICGLLRW